MRRPYRWEDDDADDPARGAWLTCAVFLAVIPAPALLGFLVLFPVWLVGGVQIIAGSLVAIAAVISLVAAWRAWQLQRRGWVRIGLLVLVVLVDMAWLALVVGDAVAAMIKLVEG